MLVCPITQMRLINPSYHRNIYKYIFKSILSCQRDTHTHTHTHTHKCTKALWFRQTGVGFGGQWELWAGPLKSTCTLCVAHCECVWDGGGSGGCGRWTFPDTEVWMHLLQSLNNLWVGTAARAKAPASPQIDAYSGEETHWPCQLNSH